jgi:chromosome partitioning protein
MKKIAIANQKGGCGKTTTAINLSGALASLGKRTLLIDLDPQAHATFGLGASHQSMDRSMYNVLTDNPERVRAINDCIARIAPNLDVAPSNILLSTLEQELKDKEDAVSKLHLFLSTSQLNYHYIIIDCPPSLGFLTFNALRAADQVIVPIDMSAFSLMGVGKLLGMLELIKIKIHHAPQVSALATLFDKRTKYSQVMYDEIGIFFKKQMMETVIRMNVDLRKAAAKGVTVMQFSKDSIGAVDYMALGKELVKAEGAGEFEKAVREAQDEALPAKAPAEPLRQTAAADAPPSRIQADEAAAPRQAVVVALASQATSAAETAPRVQPAEPEPQLSRTVAAASGPREVSFSMEAPQAKEIYLVGDFNHWKINEDSRLARRGDGRWEKMIGLGPGRYKYKFIVDGEWTLDTENGEREQNSFGTFDSIINL